MNLLGRLMAGAPQQFQQGVAPQGAPARSLMYGGQSFQPMQATAAQPATTMAKDVDVNGLGAKSFGWQSGGDQVRQNRTALVADALNNMYGQPGSDDPWGFRLSPQSRQAWQEAGVTIPGAGNEGGPESDSEIYSAITKAYRRGLVDPDGVKGALTANGGSSGLGGASNTVTAPNFGDMSFGDAFRNAVYGMNDPATGKFIGGFKQLGEVPMGSWGWGGLIGRMLNGNSGISKAGDPGGLPSNGQGAGNPGR